MSLRLDRRTVLPLVLVALVGVAAAATSLSPQEQDTLTTIDSVPTQPVLDQVFDGSAQAQSRLVEVAQDAMANPGIRLRAIHALAKYCLKTTNTTCDDDDPAHAALHALIASTASAHTGTDVLILRAAIEALGKLQVTTDLGYLTPLLNHPSRDIRAATANALRDLCNTQAIVPLRQRYNNETVDQVRLAISEALRILGQSPSVCSVN